MYAEVNLDTDIFFIIFLLFCLFDDYVRYSNIRVICFYLILFRLIHNHKAEKHDKTRIPAYWAVSFISDKDSDRRFLLDISKSNDLFLIRKIL